MVEGPTAKLYALKIGEKFKGETVRDVYAKSKRLHIPVESLLGKVFLKAETFGKNIVLHFDGLAVRVHLMMFGAIHIYDLEENLRKPERQVRLLLAGNCRKLVVYNAPIVEVDLAERLVRRLKAELGPDPLREDWNPKEALRRILGRKGEKVGVALLDQSIIAGVGNILRNEVLFRAGIHPERLVQNLKVEEVERLVYIVENLSRHFLSLKLKGERLKPILYVYNRYRQPCKKCGTPIKFYLQQPIKRKTFVCEAC
ncbi:MAG: DNA-formamidopyrimidine glycosylase family protein, partial [Candidatus Hecatellaceae archaeon]